MSKHLILASSVLFLMSACVDNPGDAETATEASAALAYWPMAVAQVNADGTVASGFNSAGTTMTARRWRLGQYQVSLPGYGWIGGDAAQGNIQVVAEGVDNRRCQFRGTTSGSGTRTLFVDCHAPDGSFDDAAFGVLFYAAPMPAPSTRVANHAYMLVLEDGSFPSNGWDYNSSGVHNSVVRTSVGRYRVNIANSSPINASVMLTPAGPDQPGNVCGVMGWSAGRVTVECRDPAGALEDTRFSLSYTVSGPTIDQQGAHAWFDGTRASPSYSAANGKYSYCSPATITASRTGPLTTVTVSGDLGSWDGSPFLHAPFVSRYGAAGYCKIESATGSGAAPSWTGTSTVRCYGPDGTVVTSPKFTFTDVTSEAAGPC